MKDDKRGDINTIYNEKNIVFAKNVLIYRIRSCARYVAMKKEIILPLWW